MRRRHDAETEITNLERAQADLPERLADVLGREPTGQESADLAAALWEAWPTDDETESVDVETAEICRDNAFREWLATHPPEP